MPSATQQPTALRGATDAVPAVPPLLQAIGGAYGSNPNASLIPVNDAKHPFIMSSIPTPPEAGQMYEGQVASMFNPQWAQLVTDAVQRNGGLGNAQDGYLSFSFNHGFVRLRNPNLSDEQNRRFAEISLVTGGGVERLPSRSQEDSGSKPNVDEWANKFISSYDTKLQTFLADPSQGMSLKDGRLRFELKVDPASGAVVSSHYRKAGGLQGFFQKAMKYISPIADIASVAFPGIGTAIAQAVKFAGNAIAKGKLMASDLVGAISGFVPMIGSGLGFAMSGASTALTNGVLGAGASLIDSKGKVGFGALLSTVGSSLGSTGNVQVDGLLQTGLGIAGKVIDKQQLSAADFAGIAAPLGQLLGKQVSVPAAIAGATSQGNGLPGWGNQLLSKLGVQLSANQVDLIKTLGTGVFNAVRQGKLTGENVAATLGDYVAKQMTSNPESQLQLNEIMKQLGASIDSKQTSIDRILQAISTGLISAQQKIQQQTV